MPDPPYLSLKQYARRTFGVPLLKIPLDAGLGCPNRDGTISRGGCVYCDARGSGTGARSSVPEQLDQGLARIRARRADPDEEPQVVAYFQAFTNTHAPIERLAEIYEPTFDHDEVTAVAIGTRPDCVGAEVMDLLAELNQRKPIWLELGLQTASNETLDRINRGHTSEKFADAARRAASQGLLVCAHVIVGLPGEDLRAVEDTARFVADLPVDMVKVHTLYVAHVPAPCKLRHWPC
ncbi:MAG: TIGR01212 family radical SAM protein [Proteobacteria bacterium]|nr:TIGR01212 family radical SAM protein [Pseudomonadota bacterium]MBU1742448.1 TIGR01212 family radical SAM protein [Pseudomonadota bacterium]